MNSYFENEVFRRLDRIDSKMDKFFEDHAELKTKVAIADARHGWFGALAGGAVALAGIAVNFFRHKL